MKTKEEILKAMEEEMPYHLPNEIVPYIGEAMEIYASQQNQWIKIESESDLPKETMPCWFIDKKDGVVAGVFVIKEEHGDIQFILDNATHYMPMPKPQPPKED